jgi:release factor glutamine methyltransferase
VPRPESEAMIDLLKQLPEVTNHLTIVDVGTGSGALGITAKLELPRCPVYLLEIDDNSLKTAKSNVDKFAADLFLIKSDLLANMKASADILLCNLPYVPDDYEINKAAKHEPAISLFGGQDGLDLYRKLFREINNLDYKPLYVLTEALSFQHKNLKAIAAEFGYKETKIASLIQQFEREK